MIFYIEIEVEKTSGKFVSKDDVAEAVIAEIDNLGEIDLDDATYEVVSISQYEPPKAAKPRQVQR